MNKVRVKEIISNYIKASDYSSEIHFINWHYPCHNLGVIIQDII
jgi:hypothetical protein